MINDSHSGSGCCPDGSVQSVVSFDQGGEWLPLQKPAYSKCDSTAKDPDKVREGGWVVERLLLEAGKGELPRMCMQQC